eukprot:1674116-Prymnesium_polylepis.1
MTPTRCHKTPPAATGRPGRPTTPTSRQKTSQQRLQRDRAHVISRPPQPRPTHSTLQAAPLSRAASVAAAPASAHSS